MDYAQRTLGRVTHLWLDLETTGLDRQLDEVIEVGAIGTDDYFDVLFERSYVLRPSARGRARMGARVVEMHRRSGLLDECGSARLPSADFHLVMDRVVAECLDLGAVRGEIVLAGSGSSEFDRQVVETQAPRAASAFFYRGLDVGIVRRAWASATGSYVSQTFQDKPHRALDDIRDHLAEARLFSMIFAMAEEAGLPSAARRALTEERAD